jgi:hypothetical protein
MAFNGDEGTVVTLTDASRWTANYRKTVSADEIIAQFIGKNQLMKILNQKGCVGIRFYYGIADNGLKNIVAVGATSDQNDMINGIILDDALPCKPYCSKANTLNS